MLNCIEGFSIGDYKLCAIATAKKPSTEEVVKSNVSDFTSGDKSLSDAAKDVYDKSFTKDEKKQIEDSVNNIKDKIGGFFN